MMFYQVIIGTIHSKNKIKHMKKIEIIETISKEESVKMTESEILKLIDKEGLIFVLQNYEIPESFILKWGKPNFESEGLPKSIVISMLNLSEEFIEKAIEIDYFEVGDIFELNMITYSNLKEDFINKYDEYINWERMMLYLCSSEKIENIEKFEWIIEKLNLWKLISANNLPIDFIRRNKNKLDWNIVSIINEFSDDEKVEFEEKIPNFKEEWDKFFIENPPSSGFSMERIVNDSLSVKDIRKLINSNIESQEKEENQRFEVKHTIDKLTSEDIQKIKSMIQSGQINNF